MPDQDPKDPKVPSYPLHRIEKMRERLLDVILYPYDMVTMQGSVVWKFVAGLRQVMPDVEPLVLFGCLRPYLGQPITRGQIVELVYRLTGNIPRLVEGQSVVAWAGSRTPEWVPLQVLECDRTRTVSNEPGVSVRFSVLAGGPCPCEIRKVWTLGQLRYVSNKLGFTRNRHDERRIPFLDSTLIVGLRLYGQIEPVSDRGGLTPTFRNVHVTASQLERNRELLRARRVRPCKLRGYQHPCFRCAVGVDQCSLATHPTTYRHEVCPGCRQNQAIDPRFPTLCVACREQFRTAPRTDQRPTKRR
jgi:hypothetical protein